MFTYNTVLLCLKILLLFAIVTNFFPTFFLLLLLLLLFSSIHFLKDITHFFIIFCAIFIGFYSYISRGFFTITWSVLFTIICWKFQRFISCQLFCHSVENLLDWFGRPFQSLIAVSLFPGISFKFKQNCLIIFNCTSILLLIVVSVMEEGCLWAENLHCSLSPLLIIAGHH